MFGYATVSPAFWKAKQATDSEVVRQQINDVFKLSEGVIKDTYIAI